jgi:hypothetical protein
MMVVPAIEGQIPPFSNQISSFAATGPGHQLLAIKC